MPDLPRPRSQLPILTHFTLPLPNTDSFYFSGELWDPSTFQPLKNDYRLKPTLKNTKKKNTMPSAASSKKKVVPLKERSSQIDQLESDTEPGPAPAQENNKINKRTQSRDKGKGKAKEKEKDKEITRIVKSTKPSTTSNSKRKRSTSPSHSDESTERQLKPTRSHSVNRMKEKLEKFRCGLIQSDDTPQQSSEPLKRRRPSKDPSPPKDLAQDTNTTVQIEETEPKKKRKKKRTESTEVLEDPVPVPAQPRPPKQKKEEEEVVYFCPEVDEDGNPIDPTSLQPSPSPTHSLNQELSPTPFHHSPRSASPINQSESRQPLVSSPQKLNNTSLTFRPPAQLEKPSPFRPTRHPLSSQVAVKPTSKQDRPDFPSSSSSNSFNLPSQMAERIRLSGSSPAPDQHELDEVQRED